MPLLLILIIIIIIITSNIYVEEKLVGGLSRSLAGKFLIFGYKTQSLFLRTNTFVDKFKFKTYRLNSNIKSRILVLIWYIMCQRKRIFPYICNNMTFRVECVYTYVCTLTNVEYPSRCFLSY